MDRGLCLQENKEKKRIRESGTTSLLSGRTANGAKKGMYLTWDGWKDIKFF